MQQLLSLVFQAEGSTQTESKGLVIVTLHFSILLQVYTMTVQPHGVRVHRGTVADFQEHRSSKASGPYTNCLS